MVKVRTVLGDIDSEEIGITLSHEHLFFDMGSKGDDDQQFMDFSSQLREIGVFQEQGGSCVVDQTTIDLGRQPPLLKRLAEATNLHIIASTGFYHEQWFPEIVHQSDVDTIAQIMIKEISEAIEGVDFQAGLIAEIGSSEVGTTELEEKVLRAAARAHLATGAPISTHTMAGSEALHQIAIFQEEGVDPRRVIISHVDLDHVEHLLMIAEQGAFLSFDTIGKPRFKDEYRMTGDDIRLEVLSAVVTAGYEDQVLLSHDISRTRYLRAKGGHGYGYLLAEFVPRLRQEMSESTIEKFLIHNPRRALAF
jgi:predicted metal-dependent phosphotriesterase family hydrolase